MLEQRKAEALADGATLCEPGRDGSAVRFFRHRKHWYLLGRWRWAVRYAMQTVEGTWEWAGPWRRWDVPWITPPELGSVIALTASEGAAS